MAAASLVATAFGIILILITAYILAAGIIGLATSVAEAQKEMTAMTIRVAGTSLEIGNYSGDNPLYLDITNTGSEKIDYTRMDVYLTADGEAPEYCGYQSSDGGRWTNNMITPDVVNPGAWDPGETLNITVTPTGGSHVHVRVVTPVGVSASKYL